MSKKRKTYLRFPVPSFLGGGSAISDEAASRRCKEKEQTLAEISNTRAEIVASQVQAFEKANVDMVRRTKQ